MDKENQIEEMVNDLENHTCMSQFQAEIASRMLYNKGYRKASEVAREIFEEIESKIKNDMEDIAESINRITDPDAIDGQYEEIATLKWVLDSIAELKKKYTEDRE